MLEDILTAPEAAELLGIKPVSVRDALLRGAMHGRKIGRDWVTTRQEVERYRRENLGQRGRPKG